MQKDRWLGLFASLILLVFLSACSQDNFSTMEPSAGLVNVVATTSVVGEVVRQVGGESIEVYTLIPPGNDPHSYEPTPQDLTLIEDADIIFMNGAGLEQFSKNLLENAGGKGKIVSLSDGIELLKIDPEHVGEGSHDETHVFDPHVFMDPTLVKIWTEVIVEALSRLDPSHSEQYQANGLQYNSELDDLDAWIKTQIATIPPEGRKIITDHFVLSYFAQRYGFEQVGAVIPATSSNVQPTAQELAQLYDQIEDLGVKAIFVASTVNPSLAQKVAQDTGAELILVYTDSVSTDRQASSYIDLIHYNVNAIVNGLR